MKRLLARLGAIACLASGIAVTTGCRSSDSKASGEAADGGSRAQNTADASSSGPKLAVTADYLHHTLSFIDFDAMVSGPDAGAAARLGEMDLSQYTQAPYGVKLTPDGKTAVVTLSPGFFLVPGAAALLLGDSTMPTGPSKVLLIDVASRSIKAELDTGDGAAGITITHDGRRALITHTATTILSVIDIEAGQLLEQVDIGGTFAEAVEVDETDTVGIVTCLMSGLAKSARTFALADVAGTLSDPIPLDNDAAGVAFFPGTKTGFVVLAYTPLGSPHSGFVAIDASDPHAPVKVNDTRWTDAVYLAFEVTPAPTRGTLLMGVSYGGAVEIREYALAGTDVTLVNHWPVTTISGFGPFGTVLDRQGRMLMTIPGGPKDRELAVLDLRDGSSFTVPWFTEPGPMGIDMH
jgi:hypothetical protein